LRLTEGFPIPACSITGEDNVIHPDILPADVPERYSTLLGTQEAMAGLFLQPVELLEQAAEIDLGTVFIDGSKI
jgi:hypothetical protein